MPFIAKLSALRATDVLRAGAKAANLGELLHVGFAVPEGFVITTEASSMSEEITKEILTAFTELDADSVAVRSSATGEDGGGAAWAGQLDTFLNTSKSDLLKNVERCRASLFSERAVAYASEFQGQQPPMSVAVIVQRMLKPEIAGVAFSVHPVNEDRNQILIESVSGLGEALVSGQVTPDTHVIEKHSGRILDERKTDAAHHLSASQIDAIRTQVEGIEQHFDQPMDIEWAIEAGKLWILQARPITTLGKRLPASYDRRIPWKLFVVRPFSLFGSSLWHGWYGSPEMRSLFGFCIRKALFFEQHKHVVRFYWDEQEQREFTTAIQRFVSEEPLQYRQCLERAFVLNAEAQSRLLLREHQLPALEESISFCFELAIHATVLPRFSLPALDVNNLEHDVLRESCEKLRALSYYPDVTKHLIIPAAIQKLQSTGLERAEERVHLLTIPEILDADYTHLERRENERSMGNHFIYQNIDGVPLDTWVDPDAMHELILEMENIPQDILTGGVKLIGDIAFEGKVRGVARIVVDEGRDKRFDEGDILVTVCSSPTMMPLIRKCAAIVTDEGGISCHAAVISRELKKPCVMNTKFATTLIRDGDMIEVDAYQGVVIVLK